MDYPNHFNVIVVGGGHAGTEAALAAARMGAKTLLLTHNLETLGQLSCNPAIGGIGKSHLVREIDALGGVMAQAADLSGIQFRVLNARKGPAVRGTRAQTDRQLYSQAIKNKLFAQQNLWIFQQEVQDLLLNQEEVYGVVTAMGLKFMATTVVLTAGTFLAGQMHIGQQNHKGGRAGDPAATLLAEKLREMPFRIARLQTSTPTRIESRSVDFSKLQEQPGDTPLPVMSFLGSADQHPQQISCWIARTNQTTHEIITASLPESPLYSGVIEGAGPRYCPSIEDKITRFADKESHQVFLEPEGLNTYEMYPNGLSTALPFAAQLNMLRSMSGLENVFITRPGYAIEYDYFDTRDLHYSLETKHVKNLFFAGQINGTTGYEEAGIQGLLAGCNAALRSFDQESWYPGREQAYLGVLLDDLLTLGTKEPYRMFTSRAEYRLLLREDNADLRLTEQGRKLGLIDDIRWQSFIQKKEAIEQEEQRLRSTWVRPETQEAQALEQSFSIKLNHEYNLLNLLARPEIDYAGLVAATGGVACNEQVAQQLEIKTKYAGYIARQQEDIARLQAAEQIALPITLDYSKISGLSLEVQDKLKQIKPHTIGQASRIPGITPAAISLLLVYLKKHQLMGTKLQKAENLDGN